LATAVLVGRVFAKLIKVGKNLFDQLLNLYQEFAAVLVHEQIVNGES
jgi:hypothetical protein